MTTPIQFLDIGNRLLATVPVQLETGTIDLPIGTVAVITLRSATTTMTALLPVDDLGNWAGVLTGLHESMTSGGKSKVVPATILDVAALNRENGRQRG